MSEQLKTLFVALLLLPMCSIPIRAQTNILFTETFQKPLGDRWKPVKFHEPTDYRIVTEGTNTCLKASVAGGCSALATKVDLEPRGGLVCSWRWKIDRCPTNGTDDKLVGFDHAARVFIAFDTFLGPPRTINYVWANHAQTNSSFEHPFSSRTKFIAVETGNKKAGQWLDEQRDIEKDWNRLFKGDPMPAIKAVGVFTDSHYTHEPVTGWYRNVSLATPELHHRTGASSEIAACQKRTTPAGVATNANSSSRP